MPCWTIQSSTAEFGENTDMTLFAQAVTEMGYRATVREGVVHFSRPGVSGTLDAKGSLTLTGADLDISTFKRAYSTEIVKSAAKRFGWNAQEKEPGKFQIVKRSL